MPASKPLRFIFNPTGTAGDAYPYIAVGLELNRRGHEVFILTNSLFAETVQQHGLNFVQVGSSVEWSDIRNDRRVHRSFLAWREAMKWGAIGTMIPVFEAIKKLHRPGATILAGPAWSFGARIARDAMEIPLATLVLNPFLLRSKIKSPITPGMYLPDWMPRWMKAEQYWFGDTFFVEPLIGKEINDFRKSLGLDPVRRYMNGWWFSPDLVLGLFHELYVPHQPDWPCSVEYVGHTLWDPPGCCERNADVQSFLGAGEPAICFVPGSVGPGDESYYGIVTEACRTLNLRGLILDKADPRFVSNLPSFMKHAAYSPLGKVLPQCRAVVHSACMGTSAQSLRAGIPQIVRPRVNDQPDLARRLVQLGVAEELPVKQFNHDNLVECLQYVLSNQALRNRCREVKQLLPEDSAASRIADRLERLPL